MSAAAMPIVPAEGQRNRPRAALDPKGLRLVHFVADRLSPEGGNLLITGFAARKSYREIARELAAAGEPISERSVARAALRWRRERAEERLLEAAGGALTAGWKVEDIAALVAAADFKEGWELRRRLRLWRRLRAFLRRPSPEGVREVETELVLFLLTWRVLREQIAGHIGGNDGR